ncbi:MAG: OsmC family protein [Caulobacter sp.]|nr:OsmC family protein [Caulobacter sp.]
MARHTATIDWSGKPGEDFAIGHYSRAHDLIFDGGLTVPGSASPSIVRAPWSVEPAADPEEMLIAALSSCHMLTFLDKARHAGFVVASYRDEAEGVMGKVGEGRYAVTKVTLRPHIVFEGRQPTPQELDALHHASHDDCFIANSVKAEVVIAAPVSAS